MSDPWQSFRRRQRAMLLACSALITASGALAQQLPPDATEARAERDGSEAARARQLLDDGLTRFRAGDYAGAIDCFRRAHAIDPLPAFLYNIAQAERLRGHHADALLAYRAFLATGPSEPFRKLAEARVVELEALSNTPPASPEGEAPLPAAPARHTQNAPRSTGPRGVVPAATRRAPAPSPRSERRPNALASVLSFGGAAVLFSLSGYFAWRSDQSSDRLSARYARGGQSWDAAAAAEERAGQRDQAFALVGLAGGVIGTGVGVWTLTFD